MPLGSSEHRLASAETRSDPGPAPADSTAAATSGQGDPAPPTLGRSTALAVHLGVTAIGVLGIVLALEVGVGTLGDPGPGLWPLAAASLVAAAGVATVVHTALGEQVESQRGSARPASAIVIAVAFVLLFSFVGVVVAVVVLFALWTRLLGGMRWPHVAAWSLLGAAALYLLFGVVIETPFPAGLTVIP